MAFELGKTANGAKYLIGNNGHKMEFTQAVINIRQELTENIVYVVGYGMEPVYCGILDDILYMGGSISSDPHTAIDFFRTEGWVWNETGEALVTVPLTTLSFKNESSETSVDVLSVNINNVAFPSISDVGSGVTKTSQANVQTQVIQDLVLTINTTLNINSAIAENGSNIINGAIQSISGGYTITFAEFNFGSNSQIKIN